MTNTNTYLMTEEELDVVHLLEVLKTFQIYGKCTTIEDAIAALDIPHMEKLVEQKLALRRKSSEGPNIAFLDSHTTRMQSRKRWPQSSAKPMLALKLARLTKKRMRMTKTSIASSMMHSMTISIMTKRMTKRTSAIRQNLGRTPDKLHLQAPLLSRAHLGRTSGKLRSQSRQSPFRGSL